MKQKCNKDCERCPFPDCIAADERMSLEDFQKSRALDRMLRDAADGKGKARVACRLYYARHRDEILAKKRAYYAANAVKCRAASRRYALENKEYTRARQREYYQKRKEARV